MNNNTTTTPSISSEKTKKKHALKTPDLKAPELRFPEFKEEWPQVKIGNLFTERKERNHPELRFLSVDKHKGVVPREETDTKTKDKENCKYVKPNDLIYARRVCEGSSGVSTDEGIVSPIYTVLIPSKNINSHFYGFYFKDIRMLNLFKKYAQGSTREVLHINEALKVPIYKPSKQEQDKIVKFIMIVTKKIVLMEHKHKELMKFKRYSIDYLYNDDAWATFRLDDIFDNFNSNLSIDSLEDNDGSYKLYGASGIIKYIDFYEEDKNYIGIVKDGASVGRIFLCDEKSSILGTLSYLHPKDGFDLYFCYYLLSIIHFQKYVVGSTIPHIYFKDYSKEKVKIPTLEKQEKIGSFLRCVDKKIELTKEKIELMKKYKQGLLQKMFI